MPVIHALFSKSIPCFLVLCLFFVTSWSVEASCPYNPPECAPGDYETRDCGNCGKETRNCGSNKKWGNWGPCLGAGECEPGQEKVHECAPCGKTTLRCDWDCRWVQNRPCEVGNQCVPGAVEVLACGNCGQETRTCDIGCVWTSPKGCEHQGQCSPGSKEKVSCGLCGKKEAFCDDSCQWVDMTQCSGQGICSPGDTQKTPYCGESHCQDNCTWSAFEGSGLPCDDKNCCTQGDRCNEAGLCLGTARNCPSGMACSPQTCSCEPCSGLPLAGVCEGTTLVRCEGTVMLRFDCGLKGQVCLNEESAPRCACIPDCLGRFCGPDGCGGICGICPQDSQCLDGICENPNMPPADLEIITGMDPGEFENKDWHISRDEPSSSGCSITPSPAGPWLLLFWCLLLGLISCRKRCH